ncbi:hypothetical protein O6H91_11G072500 [Diphasiastrum complanatum]|uniref:Uncharacterized protein n=1 Tax=Diphasiastrum complanatum TaxID=34168 RepID=A0ACC2CAK5_DIPCM|nr:hypothetical protein O6H91_11G072500 [Diphasiastrum complanatum]
MKISRLGSRGTQLRLLQPGKSFSLAAVVEGKAEYHSYWENEKRRFPRMASTKKLALKDEGSFLRKGQAWFCTTGLPSDIAIELEDMTFHLHKFPLISRCGRLARLVADISDIEDSECTIKLPGIPGGKKAFELAAKFCYDGKVGLAADNIVAMRCVADYLEMTEEFGEGNLINKTENFLNQVVLQSWKGSILALKSCERNLPYTEELQIVKRCIDSIAMKACTDPRLFGWPMSNLHPSMQSPRGSILWNGINTGARPRVSHADWWYEDAALLDLTMFEKIITAMEAKGVRAEIIAGAVIHYANKYLPGLARRQSMVGSTSTKRRVSFATPPSQDKQRIMLETLERILPMQKDVTSTHLLFGLLRVAMILNASSDCKSSLEKRIGFQIEQAVIEDLLIPSYSYTAETLYDIETVQRILDHFLIMDERVGSPSSSVQSPEGQMLSSPLLTPRMMVAKLMDAYLAEVAPDGNLKPDKFQSLAEALPDDSRLLDDGLYRAIDIYLKAHPWLSEVDRERLCRTMDCQKLSLEACTHAAQNDRLPLRIVVQVLFFEQLQLRAAFAGGFAYRNPAATPLAHESGDGTQSLQSAASWGAAVMRDNLSMKAGMEKMKAMVEELEGECMQMKQVMERQLSRKSRGSITRSFSCKTDPQVRDSHETSAERNISRLKEHTVATDLKLRQPPKLSR